MAANVQVFQEPGSDGWSVRLVGDEESEPRRFSSKREAEEEGRRLAEEHGVRLVIHGRDGEAEEKEGPAADLTDAG